MERSNELRRLTLSFYEALSTGDVASLESLFSRQDDVLLIGTDPNEWWASQARIVGMVKTQIEEMGGAVTIIPGDPQAFSEGTVGWVADQAR
jgi:hypothetical protein